MTRIRFAIITGIAAVPLALAACSSSSGGSGHPAGPLGPVGQKSSAAPVSASAAQSGSATAPAAGDSSTPSGHVVTLQNTTGFCKYAVANQALFRDLGDMGSGDGTVNVEKTKQDMQAELDAAPPDVKPDVQAVFRVMTDALNHDLPAATRDTPAAETSLQRLSNWITKHCAASGSGS